MNDRKDRAEPGVTEEAVIPVVEEQVDVAKREAVGRTVTVTTTPVTERHTVSEPVTRESVTVERVPIGKVVEEVPEVTEDGDLTVIPVVEERITIVKELVLAEEIHLRRVREETVDEQEVELRRSNVTIDE